MLKINDLTAKIENKSILNGLNLEIKSGEIHAIMVPMVLEKAHWQIFFQAKKVMKFLEK